MRRSPVRERRDDEPSRRPGNSRPDEASRVSCRRVRGSGRSACRRASISPARGWSDRCMRALPGLREGREGGAPAVRAWAVPGGQRGRLVQEEQCRPASRHRVARHPQSSVQQIQALDRQREVPSRRSGPCRHPQLPISRPRPGSDTISPKGVTRFCSSAARPEGAHGATRMRTSATTEPVARTNEVAVHLDDLVVRLDQSPPRGGSAPPGTRRQRRRPPIPGQDGGRCATRVPSRRRRRR